MRTLASGNHYKPSITSLKCSIWCSSLRRTLSGKQRNSSNTTTAIMSKVVTLGSLFPCPKWKSLKKRKLGLHDSPVCLGTSALLATKMASVFLFFLMFLFLLLFYYWSRIFLFFFLWVASYILQGFSLLYFSGLLFWSRCFFVVSIILNIQSIRSTRHVSYIKFSSQRW